MSNLYRSKNHFANLQMNVLYSSWGMELWTTVIIQSKKAKGKLFYGNGPESAHGVVWQED